MVAVNNQVQSSFKNSAFSHGLPFQYGKVYFVDSGIGSDDYAGDSSKRPFATLAQAATAIGNVSATDSGVRVIVAPGHAETLATAVDWDQAGVTITCLGQGTSRPTFTCNGVAGAGLTISANNVKLEGELFLGNLATLTSCLTITGTDVHVKGTEIRETTNGMLAGITVGSSDNDADRLLLEDVVIRMDEVGITNAGDAGIEFGADADNVTIRGCHVYGDFDDAALYIPAAGDDSENLTVENCWFENTEATGLYAVEVTSSGSMTGRFVNCDFVTRVDASEVAAVDDLVVVGCRAHTGVVGTDYADFPNYDGSGKKFVTKLTSSAMTAGNGYDACDTPQIFGVTGEVAVRVWGDCTTAVTSTCNTGTLELGVSGATAVLVPQITAGSSAIVAGDVLNNPTTTVGAGIQDTAFTVISSGADIEMTVGTNAMTAGVIDWYCEWYPLTAGSTGS